MLLVRVLGPTRQKRTKEPQLLVTRVRGTTGGSRQEVDIHFVFFLLNRTILGPTATKQHQSKPKPNPITNRPNHFQLENLSKTKFDPAKFPMPSLGGRNWTPILVTNSGHYCDDIIEFNPINHFYSMLQSKQVVEASHHNS